MDTETIEERSLTDLQDLLTRLGGWPVVDGEGWEGEGEEGKEEEEKEVFPWYELSMRAAKEGFGTDKILSVGRAGNVVSET